MKRAVTILALCLLVISVACSVFAGSGATQTGSIEQPEACDKCGMNRTTFSRSRVVVEFEDGSKGGTCSITCASYDVRPKSKKKAQRLLVADYDSKELIDVQQAVWVTGGSEKGVMTKLPKWAFSNKEGAERFISKHGGAIATYDEVIVAAKQETCKCGKHGGKQGGKPDHGEGKKPHHE